MRRMVPMALVLACASGLVAQERSLPVPGNVFVDGVPPIPMSLVDAVAPYGQFRLARIAAWHPRERRLVIATTFANVPQLHEVKFPGAARTQLTFFGDGVPARPAAVFMPNGDSLVFRRDTSRGGEAHQLFRYDFATGASTLLTDGTSRNGLPAMSKSGLVAYDSTRRDRKNSDLYVVNPADPASDRLVAQLAGQWTALAWTPDETAIIAVETLSSSESYLWRVQAASGAKTAITEKGEHPVRWTYAAVAPDGAIYALGNYQSEHARVWRFEAGRWTAVTPENIVIEAAALSPDGRTVAIAVDKGATSQLELVDAAGRPRQQPALPPGIISDLQWHGGRNEVAFNLAGARSFSDVYSVDAATGKAEQWTRSETGAAAVESLPDAQVVTWKSFDGLGISGVLYRPHPKFAGPRPVIINVHGGPVDRERPRSIGRSNYFRAELGIAVIHPNIRGSAGFGRSFEELDNGRLRENAIKDVGALLDWIRDEPSLDETRVMISGASYGGFVALAAGVAYPDRLRGVNPAFGITDFLTYLQSTDVSRQANRNREYGDPADPEMREFLARISPLTHVARLKMPIFIAAGARDTRVPVGQAEIMVKALKAAGTPVWYVRFEDAGHAELTPATADFSIYTWIMFVRQHLLN